MICVVDSHYESIHVVWYQIKSGQLIYIGLQQQTYDCFIWESNFI